MIHGETGASYATVKNCVLQDSYQHLLKVTTDDANAPGVTANYGTVQNCLFQYTAGIGPEYYIGGIDCHGGQNWEVSNNVFQYIISPSGSVAQHAIAFWDASANNVVEQNLIINCDRGIGFGLNQYSNNSTSTQNDNTGGIIRNNMIYHGANEGQFADVGIGLAGSPNTQVYNNTVYLNSGFQWTIEYRFTNTTGVLIANNLTNLYINDRDGATGTVSTNVTTAQPSWFVNLTAGNLNLASAVAGVVVSGQTIAGLTNDYNGNPRPATKPDIGADQYTGALPAPTNLKVTN
jgi:hypothetical protein